MTDSSPQPPKPRRPKLQFTLRMLLVLTAVLALWLNVQLNSARRQQAAVQKIQAYGGSVRYDFERNRKRELRKPGEPQWLLELLGRDFLHNVEQVNLTKAFVNSDPRRRDVHVQTDLVRELLNLPGVRFLSLQGDQANDATMKVIAQLQSLEELRITSAAYVSGPQAIVIRPQISNAGFSSFSKLSRLKLLDVRDNLATDQTLSYVSRMTSLQELRFDGAACHFTDDGLRELRGLDALRQLTLSPQFGATDITDRGLSHLVKLPQLERIALRGRRITPQALSQLAALPKIKVIQIASNSVPQSERAKLSAAYPQILVTIHPYRDIVDNLCLSVSRHLGLTPDAVTPDSRLADLCSPEDYEKLIIDLREGHFRNDLDEAPHVQAFLLRARQTQRITISDLAKIIQETIGR